MLKQNNIKNSKFLNINNKIKVCITILLILIILLVNSISYAGDILYHIMYGHQDYLAIGQIISKKDNTFTIEVSELIAEASIRKDIPKVIEVEINATWLSEKDNVCISLSKRAGGYQLENGVYKLTTNDTDTLEVVNTISASTMAAEDAALELFLKSRGAIKDFYFQVYEAYVAKTPNLASNEDLCIYSPETGKLLPTEFEKNEKYIIKESKNIFLIILCTIILFVIIQAATIYIYLKITRKFKLRVFLKEKFKNCKDKETNEESKIQKNKSN